MTVHGQMLEPGQINVSEETVHVRALSKLLDLSKLHWGIECIVRSVFIKLHHVQPMRGTAAQSLVYRFYDRRSDRASPIPIPL